MNGKKAKRLRAAARAMTLVHDVALERRDYSPRIVTWGPHSYSIPRFTLSHRDGTYRAVLRALKRKQRSPKANPSVLRRMGREAKW